MLRSIAANAFLALPALALGLAAAPCRAQAASGPVACAILAERDAGHVVLRIEIRTGAPLSGTYALVAAQTGRGNNAHASQRGPFTVGAGQSVLNNTVALGGQGPVEAALELRRPDGTLLCARNL